MSMKNILYIIVILIFDITSGQVLITSGINDNSNTNDQIILYINNGNESTGAKGFGLPSLNTVAELPYTGTERPTSKIDILKGMLMYVKNPGEAMVFDGQDWSKAFNVEGDNISRFRINSVSTTNGQVPLTIDATIDKANYFADPLKLKTNVLEADKLYIRQSGVYRISLDLVFTTSSPSIISNRLGIKLSVNGGSRFDLLENYANNTDNIYMISLDTSVYVRQGDYLTFSTVPDTSGTTTFTITNTSAITVEKIM